MKIYTAKNLEWIFYRLKSQGKIKLTEVDGMNEILKQLKRSNYAIGVLAKRRKKIRDRVKNIDAEQEVETLCRFDDLIRRIDERLNELRAIRTELERTGDKLINKFIEETYNRIIRNRIRVKPEIDHIEPNKPVVSVSELEEKLVCQLIKEDLKRVYKVVPADRNEIITQIKALLSGHTKKVIIRADIKSFFESVPLDSVIDKLLRDAYLNKLSLTYLR